MKVQGDRKKSSGSHHLDKYPDKYSSSSKGKYGQTYKDRRQPIVEKANTQKSNDEAPPSQHLWIGNVSTSVTKTMLAEQFSRFGDIESIKLFSQKNYAFVTLKTVEDAVYAKKGLHGTLLGGLAVRIEFARGVQDGRLNSHAEVDEKTSHERERQTEEKIIYQDKGQKDGTQEKKVVVMKSVSSDDISRHSSDNFKGNKNGDPSEVLWIGFPLHLKIDERKLHKLFAPFGGVEKITTFPGRTYAFVRFQNVKAASRAKDALQGKLFDDPRVSISFAKSEVGPLEHLHSTSELRPPSPSKVGSRTLTSTSSLKGMEGTSVHLTTTSTKLGVETSRYSIASPRKEELLPSIAPIASFGNLTSHSDPKNVRTDSHWAASHFFPSRSGTGVHEKPHSSPNHYIEPKFNADVKDDFSENASSKHGLKSEIDKGSHVLRNDNFWEMRESKSDENWLPRDEYSNIRDQKRGRFEMEHPNGGSLISLGSPSAIIEKLRTQGEDGEAKRQRLGNEQFWVEAKNNKPPDYINQRGNPLSSETWDEQKVTNTALIGRTPVGNNKDEMNISLGPHDSFETKEGPHRGLLGRMPPADSNLDQTLSQSEHGLVESPISPPCTDVGSPICPPTKDVFRWEGTIAKGGVEVCRCRCFPATKEIDVMFPESLNCTARTSLEMLAQYISQVRDFAVVLFMPQGVPDVAPYQELMAFLADKQRAAVCKLSEENTLFLVPPSDFVEQFLNVPKSNNILGVVLGQQQRIQPSQVSTDQNVLLKSQQSCDVKKQSHQKPDAYATTEESVMFPVHSSTESKTIKPSPSQQNRYQLESYQLESSKLDPAVPGSFDNVFRKSRVGPDTLQGHDVLADSGMLLYATQGSKSLPMEYQAHEDNPLPEIRSLPFQVPGNMLTPMSIPTPQGLFGSPNLLPGSKLLPHQDPVMPPRPPMFFPPRTAEQLSVPAGSGQMSTESQRLIGSFPLHERPWSAPMVPQSVPMTQLNPPMAHPQQQFSYGSIPSQQQFPSFDGRQQDGQVQPSSFTFRSFATNTRTMPAPYPVAPESGLRPPGLPPGPPSLDAGSRPPGPSPVALSQDRDQQGSETDQHQAFHNALAGMQNPDSSEEEQKKFRATVELAAALLQQLQQQTKL